MSLFIPLCKVDAAQRLVYGQIDETPDRAGEVFDYKSSKRHFMSWSKTIQKATGGKSFGNVRAMHGAVAAGKLEDIQFDDKARRIQLTARIVDDGEWEKVEQGVYTGFSPGGRYVKRWRDGNLTRYTAEPSEISIVDLPCIPSASFTLVKADGAEEQVAFNPDGSDDASSDDDQGDASGDDNDADNDGDNEPPDSYSPERLADLLSSLDWLDDSADWEQDWALGNQPMPEEIRSWLETGASLLEPYMSDDNDDQGDNDGGDDAFAASANPRGLMKLQRDLQDLRQNLGRLVGERDLLKRRVSALEAQPKPGGPVLKAVSKGEDVGYSAAEQEQMIKSMNNGEAKSLAMIKLAHQQPKVLRF